MRNKNLEGWLFTYSPYTDQWKAVNRDHYTELFNSHNSPLVLRSSRFETLISLILKTNGDRSKINKLVEGG